MEQTSGTERALLQTRSNSHVKNGQNNLFQAFWPSYKWLTTETLQADSGCWLAQFCIELFRLNLPTGQESTGHKNHHSRFIMRHWSYSALSNLLELNKPLVHCCVKSFLVCLSADTHWLLLEFLILLSGQPSHMAGLSRHEKNILICSTVALLWGRNGVDFAPHMYQTASSFPSLNLFVGINHRIPRPSHKTCCCGDTSLA